MFSKKKREDKKRNKNKLKSKLSDEDIPDLADMLGEKMKMGCRATSLLEKRPEMHAIAKVTNIPKHLFSIV